MQKDFENQQLKIMDENNKETYINLVELNHIREKDKNSSNGKLIYYILYFMIGLLLFLFVLFLLFDKNSYLINKIAKNEKVRNYFLSKMASKNISISYNVTDNSKNSNGNIDQGNEDINKLKEDFDKEKENNRHTKEDLDRLKEDLNKAKDNADKAIEEANKAKDDLNKIQQDLDKTKEELNKIKEDLGKESYNKDKEVDKNKEEFDKNREEKKEDNKETGKFYTPEVYGEKKLEISFDYKDAIKAQLDKKLDYMKIYSFPKDKKKFALCTIGKLENLYARDFALYYLELGVDKIYIYDNNEINGEKFEDVLHDLIDKNYVEIIDMRGMQDDNPQKKAYEKCYNDHYDKFDWFLFFDFDEYLYVEEKTLDTFVKLPLYDKCSSILLYWRLYTDNDKKNYTTESPIKRFTEPISKNQQRLSYFCDKKVIIKGGMKEFSYDETNHIPKFASDKNPSEYLICNSEGKDYDKNKNDKESIISFENAYIKHFLWRSTEEYCLKLGIRKFFKYLKYEKKDYDFFIDQYLMYNGGYSGDNKKENLKKCVE